MRSITTQGLNLIKKFERFMPHIYICPAGYRTIGYGHVIRKREVAEFANGIDEPKAEQILAQDVSAAEHAVLSLINVPLFNWQFDALVSFTFNLGSGAFQRSTLRQKVNRQEHEDVPNEFMRWIYADGRRLRGLALRREAEARLYMQ
jgi:lysozyme